MPLVKMGGDTYTPNAYNQLKPCSVDFDVRTVQAPVHLVQYDRTLPILAVNLYKSGQPYAVPAGANVMVRLHKSDGFVVYNPALGISTDRTVAYVAITVQMTTCWGKHEAVIEVELDDQVACSGTLVLDVDKNPVQQGDIESTNEFKTLVELVKLANKKAEEAKASAEASAESARRSADSANASAQSAAESQNSADNSENSAAASKKSAEESAKSAESSRKSAENSENSATNSKNSADQAKASENGAGQSAKNAERNAQNSRSTVVHYATFTAAGWNDVTHGKYKFVQTAAIASDYPNAAPVTTSTKFLSGPFAEGTGDPDTDEAIAEALTIINGANCTPGDGTVTLLSVEKPDIDVTVCWQTQAQEPDPNKAGWIDETLTIPGKAADAARVGKLLETVSAYAEAKEHGFTGTREEFGALMGNSANNLQQAQYARDEARKQAEHAKGSADLAQQCANQNGYMQMHIDEDTGHLMYRRTTNIKDTVVFTIKNDTNLEVSIYAQ